MKFLGKSVWERKKNKYAIITLFSWSIYSHRLFQPSTNHWGGNHKQNRYMQPFRRALIFELSIILFQDWVWNLAGFCSLRNLPGLEWHTMFFIIVMRTAVVSGLKQGKKNHMIILVWNRKQGQRFRMNATCTPHWIFSRSIRNVIPIPPSAAHFPQARSKSVLIYMYLYCLWL